MTPPVTTTEHRHSRYGGRAIKNDSDMIEKNVYRILNNNTKPLIIT